MTIVIAVVSLLLLAQAGGPSPSRNIVTLDSVRAMLDAGVDPNAVDHSGATLLHYAALHNRPELAALLLDRKANVNAVISQPGVETGATALIYAVVQHNVPLATMLIEHRADVNLAYRFGTTPLHIAAGQGMTEMTRLLLKAGAKPNVRDRHGSSPLDEAAWRGFRDVVALLLESGAALNEVQSKTGATPLNEAALTGHDQVVRLLLVSNADVTIRDKAGFSPIENAVRLNQADVVKTLLDHRQAGEIDESLTDLFEEAVNKHEGEIVRLLVENGADVNVQFRSGATPLDAAAFQGNEGIVSILIAHGAATNARSKIGATPLQDAALSGHAGVVRLLLANGAEVNARDTQSGATALYMAASFGHEDVVTLLLEKGADPNICNSQGVSPLHVAIENGHTTIATLIRAHKGRDLIH